MGNDMRWWEQRRGKAVLVQKQLPSDLAHRGGQKLVQNGVDIESFFIHPQNCTRLDRIKWKEPRERHCFHVERRGMR